MIMTLLWALWLGWTAAGVYYLCWVFREILGQAKFITDYLQEQHRHAAFRLLDTNKRTDYTNEILANIANAIIDQRNWKQEDRDNRTIDDFPIVTPPSVDPPKEPAEDTILYSSPPKDQDPNGTQILEEITCPVRCSCPKHSVRE